MLIKFLSVCVYVCAVSTLMHSFQNMAFFRPVRIDHLALEIMVL